MRTGGLAIGVEISQAYAGKMLVNRKRKIASRYALRGQGMISYQYRKAEQPLCKAIGRNPLVILDQQLQSLAKEGDDAIRKQKRGRGRR
jgi:hypothetical protein